MVSGTSARLGLPMLAAGQAQKEITHNEALALLDTALCAAVDGVGADVPPADPAEGMAWIVGNAPTGAWTGRAKALAGWTAGGWRFVPATEGMTAWVKGRGVEARFRAGAWVVGQVTAVSLVVDGLPVVGARRPAIAAPAGGAAADDEARRAVTAILETLRSHGLIER